MISRQYLQEIPKVELHVHFEGSVRPESVLKLAENNGVQLPAMDLQGLQDWYSFRDFEHFVQVYVAISKCIQTGEDLVWLGEEFVRGQLAQNIVHTEATFTAGTLFKYAGIPWQDQLAALRHTQAYAKEQGIHVQFILDIVRGQPEESAKNTLDWALEAQEAGVVCALGLAGVEKEGTLQYKEFIQEAEKAGLPFVPHAGETLGPESIWECLKVGNPPRIGHGVRCLEDAGLVAELKSRGTVLEVCPTSNVALKVFPNLEEHPIQRLMDEGLNVTVNSDDPPLFSTTLTDDLWRCTQIFGWTEDVIAELQVRAAASALVEDREGLVERILASELP